MPAAKFTANFGETACRVPKFGLHVMMQIFCAELAPLGIRVNLVTPGRYATRQSGWDRLDRAKVASGQTDLG